MASLVPSKNIIDPDFPDTFIKTQNKFRAQHHAPPLKLSKSLSQESQTWATKLVSEGCLQHSVRNYTRKPGTGESVFHYDARLSFHSTPLDIHSTNYFFIIFRGILGPEGTQNKVA